MDIKIFSSQSFLTRLSDFVLCLLIKGLSNLSLCQSFAIEEEKLYLTEAQHRIILTLLCIMLKNC